MGENGPGSKDKLRGYQQTMSKDGGNRIGRSSFRAFICSAFGKDCFFDLFLAFDTVAPEMVDCYNDECLHRKNNAIGSQQGGGVPTTSAGTVQ